MKARPQYRMISWVAERYSVHPQTLRLWEREGLLRPVRSQGNTRLYDEETCRRLETILTLTRDLGVNLAGVEIILNLKEQVRQLQHESEELAQMLRQAMQQREAIPRYHALVKVGTGSIQLVNDE